MTVHEIVTLLEANKVPYTMTCLRDDIVCFTFKDGDSNICELEVYPVGNLELEKYSPGGVHGLLPSEAKDLIGYPR